jgi:hypothetical protein
MGRESRTGFRRATDEDARMHTATAITLLAILWPFAAAEGGRPLPSLPDGLPRYSLNVRLDTACRKATAKQTVVWTNAGIAPTQELVFHVIPRHKPNPRQQMLFERTIESLRMDARESFDREGRRSTIDCVKSASGEPLPFSFDEECDTHMTVKLPAAVAPGASVTVHLEWTLDIPELQGRIGNWQGVTSLVSWVPMLAVYDKDRWDPVPFIPWHLSFYTEAAHYDVTLETPADEVVAASGSIVGKEILPDGWQRLNIKGRALRDFTIVASKRFQVCERNIGGVPMRVVCFPEHAAAGEAMLDAVAESLPCFEEWFGPFPFPEFTLCESFFGWNGNQSAGMVLIDERVFRAPVVGRKYVEHLVTHEFCHQWWYAMIGNDGYREIWLSESFASYFTKLRMQKAHGRDCQVISWPDGFRWLPNITYDTLTYSGYYLYRGRGGKGKTVAPLPDIGHLHNLFFLVYDRGNRIVGMIHHRLGDERFFEFLRRIAAKFAYRNLHTFELQRELEEFTGSSWSGFFDDWLYSPKVSDWKVAGMKSHPCKDGFVTTATIKQKGEICEPVPVVFRTKDGGPAFASFLFDPRMGEGVHGDVEIKQTGPLEWQATIHSTEEPDQVALDPDRRLFDANLSDNVWRRHVHLRFTPLYTPIDESALIRPLDEPSFRFGPNIDMEGRIGVRGSLIRGTRYRVSPFVAYQEQRGMITAGVDAEFFNAIAPNVSAGVRYEHTLQSALYDAPTDQGKIFARWYQAYTSSFVYPHLAFLEGYFRFGDNFFPAFEGIRQPTDPDLLDYRSIRSVGLTWHADTRFPYWNPEKGYAVDLNGEVGFRWMGGDPYQRASGQLAAVRRLPDCLGPLSELRVAGRVAGGYGSPDNGLHFRFGGPAGFRGQRSEDSRGSAFWLASSELRFPLLTRMETPIADNLLTWKSLYGSVFYDVGDMWSKGEAYGIDHTIGAGLYFDLGAMSFAERFGLRMELGHSVNQGTNIVWVGLFRAF